MGMFDSVYIEKHKCPKCGNVMMDGELQTKDLGCTLAHWKFPDYIPDVDVEEVRKIHLFDYCSKCGGIDWTGLIRNQVLCKLESPSGEVREVEPSDALRDALAEVLVAKQESLSRRSSAKSFAVFIWKFHPDKRDILFKILKERFGVTKKDFEKYTVSSCLNPLHNAFGIIGGSQTDYWKLEGKSEEQKEAEKNFVRDAMDRLPAGSPERYAVVDAVDIEELMPK